MQTAILFCRVLKTRYSTLWIGLMGMIQIRNYSQNHKQYRPQKQLRGWCRDGEERVDPDVLRNLEDVHVALFAYRL